MKPAKPHKRAGYWYLIRRVPTAFAALDTRGLVRVSTHIAVADDPRGVRAARAVAKISADLEAYWRGLLVGQGAEARREYDDARRLARALGFDYAPAHEVARRDLGELVGRIEAIVRRDASDRAPEVAAVLGGVAKPEIRLSGLLDEFEAMNRAALSRMSDDQVRKWRNPKRRALENLIGAIGDKALGQITRADALDFRDWWQGRIVAEEIEIATANKDIGHLNKMLRSVDQAHRIGLQPVFAGLRLDGERDGQRTAYPPAFVQERFMAEGAFAELNDEARRIILLVAETGLRPSEAANLTQAAIRLDADVPHVRVEADGRKLKTEHSQRDVPLVGVALKVMEAQPAGFPRYRDKSASLSALANKALSARGLRPTPGHSLYSLRHTFEDRLTAVEAPEKVTASLMGHKWIRPKYGVGPSLAQKRDWMLKIAFDPPSTV